MRASSSTSLIMKVIVASAWLPVLLASVSLAASDDAGAASVAAARLAVQPRVRRADKSSWSEVVGMSEEEAKKKICGDGPCDYVHVIPDGYAVTMDYDTRRVRVFLDSNGKVAEVPRIG